MKILQKTLRLSAEEFYRMHLSLVNSLSSEKMTEKEVDVLVAFMTLDKNITQDDMFNSLARKHVKQKLNNMSAGGMSNNLRTLINKGFLIKNEITKKITPKESLFPGEPVSGYQIKLIKIEQNGEQ